MGSLTIRTPIDWKDLQREVAAILAECGFAVESPRQVNTVRASVELDVFAREEIDNRLYSIVCECKHWKTAVPQTVVHAFRTVLADLGTHCGYIISRAGFQSGCDKAVTNTNIKLLDWNGFQDEFKETWVTKHFFPEIADKLDRIITFTEPLIPKWFLEVSDDDKNILKALHRKHMAFGILAMMFTPYCRFGGNPYPSLPLRSAFATRWEGEHFIPNAILDATGYRDLRDAMLAHGKAATAEFEEIRRRNGYKDTD